MQRLALVFLLAVAWTGCRDLREPLRPEIPSLPAFSSSSGGGESRITTDPDLQYYPDISGDRIVWMDHRHGNWDIYLYDISTRQERRITKNESVQQRPKISGDRIVWMDGRDNNVYLYDLSTATETRVSSGQGYYPDIDGDRIVWGADGDIYLYDLSTSTQTQLTTAGAASIPRISGNRIVWVDRRAHGFGEIHLYDLATGQERRITTDPYLQIWPAISGNRIVWVDGRNGDINSRADIYMYDLSTGVEARITMSDAHQSEPAIDGDRIVWRDSRNGNADVYLYDVLAGEERRITTDHSHQWWPSISGDRIGWMDHRHGNWDIYLYDLAFSPNAPPVADAGGPYIGAAGAPVQFDGSASSDADGDSLTFLWDFGDGSTGTGPTPTHTYSANGPYAVSLTVSDPSGASATDTTSIQIGHKVVLTVTGSPPVAGVVVTAVKATGADGGGEYQVQLTDAAGQATFYLSDAGWLFHARNLGDRGPEDEGFFLARAPLPEGQGLLQTGTTEGVNHVGVFYDPGGANTSVTYSPENLERLTANPVLLSGGSSAREIGVDFEAGATVTCDLRNEDGSPLVVPAPENVFLIVPHREGARLPPLPAGIPGSDLPRAMLVSAATIQAGASTCSLAGVASSDGYEAAPVLETNPIVVNGEEKLFVQPFEVTDAQASGGGTVQTLIVAEPRRAKLEYVEDAWDDTQGDGDLGLLSYGWTTENQRVSDVFALAAHVRGESRYELHLRYTDPSTGREQSIRSTLEWDAAQKEWTVVEQTPHRLPAGVEVRVTGYAEGSGADLEGTAIWRVTVPGVDELEFRVIGGVSGRFDFAPDRDFRAATKPTEDGNTWLVGVSEEE